MTREVLELLITNLISLVFGIMIGVGIAIKVMVSIARSGATKVTH